MGHRRGKGRRWEFYSEAGEIGETKGLRVEAKRKGGGSWECKVLETRGMDHLHDSLKRIGEVASGGVVNLFCHYNSTTSYRQLNHRIL